MAIFIFALPLLLVLDYLAIVVWLMRTSGEKARSVRFSMRTLLFSITIVAIHLALISAFLSAHT
jgi:hypothetical protein